MQQSNNLKLLAVSIILTFIVMMSVTYAWVRIGKTSIKNNVLKAGSLDLELDDKTSNGIFLDEVIPMSYRQGMRTVEYTFELKNKGIESEYELSLIDEDKYKQEDGYERNITETEKLDDSKIRYILLKNGEKEDSTKTTLLSKTVNRVIDEGKIEKNQTIKYSLRLWIDSTAETEVMGKVFNARLHLNAKQINNNKIEVENPIIRLNGSKEKIVILNEEYKDPGVNKIISKENLNVENITKRYEYYNGKTTETVLDVDTSKIGIYYEYYEIEDSKHNKGLVTRVINVVDKKQINPTINLIGEDLEELNYNDEYVESGYLAYDQTKKDITENVIVENNINQNKVGVYTVKYIVKDSYGNIGSKTREVIVSQKNKNIVLETEVLENSNVDSTIKLVGTSNSEKLYYVVVRRETDLSKMKFNDMDLIKTGIKNEFIKEMKINKNGTYYVYVKDNNNNIIVKKVKITNVKPEEKAVKLDISSSNTYEIKDDELKNDELIYESENEGVATVTREGIIKGIAPGNSIITVKEKDGNIQQEIIVTVVKTIKAIYEKQSLGVETIEKEEDSCEVVDQSGICRVLLPNVKVKEGYTFIGWNADKTSTTGILQNTEIELSDNQKFYTIVKKDAITLSATFNKNGATSLDGNTDEVITKTCVIEESYNNEEQKTSCDITTPTIEASTATPTVCGYTTTSNGTSTCSIKAQEEMTLKENGLKYYAQTYKAGVVHKIIWSANGATIGSTASSCSIDATYNGVAQRAGCDITSPSIARTGYTIYGWNTTASATTSTWNVGVAKQVSNSATYYAITKDTTAPSCGSWSGESTTWTGDNRTISVGCTDSGSGCKQTTYSKVFSTNTKTSAVSFTISDNAGNTRTCSKTANVYVAKTANIVFQTYNGASSNKDISNVAAGNGPYINYNGGISGRINQASAIQRIYVYASADNISGGVNYQYHQQTSGTSGNIGNGTWVGTSGKRMEAIRIWLTDDMANAFDIYYRSFVQGQGWLINPAVNGGWTGSYGLCKRMEAIQIGIYPKGTTTAESISNSWSLGGYNAGYGATYLTSSSYTNCS